MSTSLCGLLIDRIYGRLPRWVKQSIKLQRELKEISCLTDRDLKDIGVSRYELATSAKQRSTYASIY
jgi:uncharacterized protein YjiS (DUF1127 family)